MRVVLMLVMVVLVGCAGWQEDESRMVRVEVPVVVPCRVAVVDVPAWATKGLKADDDLQIKVRALLAEIRQHRGYEAKMLAAILACQ
ncbi:MULTISPECIES: hypothetical protein [Pseudomonas]|uniref:hypothetical protein n=1 Tax=Pseudomonas TaxID=286 RepID=UPI0003513413|nr:MULTISPECIES: hypothetical protein [Pseudomonas]AGO43523.1 hypothetical protein M062_14920 [Pseudomonas aeruginosa RP73]AKQ16348.1 lipoprotein [Pseudomonas aeruginosa]ALY48404.1 hypothetical protein HW08_13705 [Pseudomonas aeruginosa]EIU2719447.1 hypothetical protein [Pseudomonas aeruginosa]EIU2860927.1 hypothetical protein [Pseudomonas aeruginosa]